ncbi:ElyC/SanA/YdcF family protein [Lipingzhangella sp. LS1_29]|uniref:ElyC/SanA/YdcF family protein n=1 Tax=Lipingzhangella rawalii TaxID=2055835 RepID=A0ABU2HB90_9ACTN|nr:ElyC/SanA/YdcF family protein [Lipingzhangella rawalii]MDS1272605.1 ElyC/SanA/YdcF family protein [Lipingzhangella rawalii]
MGLGIAFVLPPLLLLLPTGWAYLASRGRRFTTVDCPPREVAVVLGALVPPSGYPSPLLRQRLDAAAELYHNAVVSSLLVSGDNRAAANHETDAMARYLHQVHALPTRAIRADPHGFRTWDTCRHAVSSSPGPPVRSAVFVTQAFHLPRTLALARVAGIDAVGVGVASLSVRRRATYYGYAREVAATARAALDVALRRG